MEVLERSRNAKERCDFLRSSLLVAGLFVSGISFAGETADFYRSIAELAKNDPVVAAEKLRTNSDLEPDLLYKAFEGLDAASHFRLLHEITKDESLANRFAFNSLLLIPGSLEELAVDKVDGESVRDAVIRIRNESISSILDSAPDEMSPILLLPAVVEKLLFFGSFVIKKNIPAEARGSALLQSLDDFSGERVPPEFRPILVLAAEFHKGGEEKAQVAILQITQLLDDAEIPLSVRLSFAGMGSSASEHPTDSARIKIANRLAEAWEKDIPVGWRVAPEILKSFLESDKDTVWKPTAKRLIAAWPGTSDINDNSFSWIVGVAAGLDDRASVEKFIAKVPESHPNLAKDPMLALLVQAGYHDLAIRQIHVRKFELLQQSDSVRDVLFDAKLESEIPDFLKTITNPELCFLVELHLTILDDDPKSPPKIDRKTRITEIARRIETIKFKEPRAKLTALRLIGKIPSAAAEIVDVYVM